MHSMKEGYGMPQSWIPYLEQRHEKERFCPQPICVEEVLQALGLQREGGIGGKYGDFIEGRRAGHSCVLRAASLLLPPLPPSPTWA